MKSKYQVSVVLPVYNGANYLSEAIESILEQTLTNFELIVIDDGSTDSSKEIIQKYASVDSRVKLISRENKGLVYSLNQAIKLSNSDIIARMDADDKSHPQRLKVQYEYLANHPEVVALGTQINYMCQRGISFMESSFPREHSSIEKVLLKDDGIQFCHPTIMMRKEAVIEAGLYDESIKMSEDVDLFLRLALIGKLHNLDDRLLDYRRHSKNITSSSNVNNHEFDLSHLERAWKSRGKSMPVDFIHWSKTSKFRTQKEDYLQWGWNALKKKQLHVARAYAKDLVFSRDVLTREVLKFVYCSLRGF